MIVCKLMHVVKVYWRCIVKVTALKICMIGCLCRHWWYIGYGPCSIFLYTSMHEFESNQSHLLFYIYNFICDLLSMTTCLLSYCWFLSAIDINWLCTFRPQWWVSKEQHSSYNRMQCQTASVATCKVRFCRTS